MSHRHKQKMQRHGNCCKETIRNETKKLLQYFLQSDSDCFAELPLPPQRLTTHFGPKKVPTPLPIGAFMISAVERTDATDDIASAGIDCIVGTIVCIYTAAILCCFFINT